MQIDVNDVISKLSLEVAQLTQRAVLAEVRADTAEKALESKEEDTTDGS